MTPSIATHQFPQVVWREGKKQLWNPIHRKPLINRPEERVRLRIIEYLLDGGWSRHRISTEEALKASPKETQLRTDLICYTQGFDPFLLVECKAEEVPITEQTANQIARYNQDVGAPFLLMTNGRRDFWYRIEGGSQVKILDGIPKELPVADNPEHQSLAYWKERGFAGQKAIPALRKWLKKALNISLLQTEGTIRFLSFKSSPSDLDLNNYYVVIPHAPYRLALTFTNTPFGGSRLVIIINKDRENIGVLEANLDLLFEGESLNASFYDAGGIQNITVSSYINPDPRDLRFPSFLEQLKKLIEKLV